MAKNFDEKVADEHITSEHKACEIYSMRRLGKTGGPAKIESIYVLADATTLVFFAAIFAAFR